MNYKTAEHLTYQDAQIRRTRRTRAGYRFIICIIFSALVYMSALWVELSMSTSKEIEAKDKIIANYASEKACEYWGGP